MVEIKTFVEVANDVNKVWKGEGIVFTLDIFSLDFCLAIQVCYYFITFIFIHGGNSLAGGVVVSKSIFCNAFQNIKFLMQMSL